MKIRKISLRKTAGRLGDKISGVQLSPGAAAAEQVRRPVRMQTEAYFRRARKVWELCVVSLPVDFAIFALLPAGSRDTATGTIVLFLLLFIAVFILFRQSLITGSVIFRVLRNQMLAKRRRSLLFVFVGTALVLTFLDSWLRHSESGKAGWIISLSLVCLAIWPAIASARERLDQTFRKWRNRLVWIEELEKRLFVLSTGPLIPARLLSLAGAATSSDFGNFCCCFIASCLLLLSLEPAERDFFVLCRRCLRKTSGAMTGTRYCPECSRLGFYIFEAIVPVARSKASKTAGRARRTGTA